RSWLTGQLGAGRLVIKDPRAFWLSSMWIDAIRSAGGTPKFVTMTRHPAEVVGSRDMHYLANLPDSERQSRETTNLAGWVNVALSSERVNRGTARSFVRYPGLLADWRSTMQRLGDRLDLRYDADLSTGEPHEIDRFIDAGLHRS